eukprot:241375-Amphidinium_carterae.1
MQACKCDVFGYNASIAGPRCSWACVQEIRKFVVAAGANGRYEVSYNRKADLTRGRRFVAGRGFQSLSRRLLARACPPT